MMESVDLFKKEKRNNCEMDANYATISALHVVKNQVLDTNDRLDMALHSVMKQGLFPTTGEPHSEQKARFMLDKFNDEARKLDFGSRNQLRETDKSRRKEWLKNLREAILAGNEEQ